MAVSLGHALLALRADVRGLRMDMSSAERIVSSSFSNMGRIASSAVAVLAIAEAIKGMKDLAGAVINVNDKFDRMHMTLGVVLKDQVRANALIKDMQQFAADTPFNTSSLMEAFQLLRNYGMETRKILPALKNIGDAAAASPRGMEFTVHRIALAIGQMKSQGKLMGQELRQLAEAGVGANEILQKHFNASIPEIQKMVKSGAISIDQVIDALLQGMDQRFGGTMQKLAHSWSGLMERIRDKGQIAIRQITEPLFELARSGLQIFADMFDSDGFKNFAGGMRSLFQSVSSFASSMSTAFAPIGQSIAGAFRNLSPVIKEISANLEPFVRSFLTFANAGVVSAIRAIAPAITLISAGIKEVLDTVALFTTDFGLTWEYAQVVVLQAAEAIRSELQFLWDSMTVGATNAGLAMMRVFSQIFTEVKTIFGAMASFVSQIMLVITDSFTSFFTSLKELMSANARELPAALIKFRSDSMAAATNANVRIANAIGTVAAATGGAIGAPGRIADAATNGSSIAMPQRTESATSKWLAERAKQLLAQMTRSRETNQRDRRLREQNAAVGGAIRNGLTGVGGMATGLANMVGGGFFGALGQVRQKFGGGPGEDKKRPKAEFVGLAEMSRKIQMGILDNEEKKDRKALVKGVGVVGKGVDAVKGAVDNVTKAIKGWLPKAT